MVCSHLCVKFGIAHPDNVTSNIQSESIEWCLEDQAFSPSYDLTPPHPLPLGSTVSFSVLLCVAGRFYGRGERRVWGRSQIIRRESLVLYKSFNTLYIQPCSMWLWERGGGGSEICYNLVYNFRRGIWTSYVKVGTSNSHKIHQFL